MCFHFSCLCRRGQGDWTYFSILRGYSWFSTNPLEHRKNWEYNYKRESWKLTGGKLLLSVCTFDLTACFQVQTSEWDWCFRRIPACSVQSVRTSQESQVKPQCRWTRKHRREGCECCPLGNALTHQLFTRTLWLSPYLVERDYAWDSLD